MKWVGVVLLALAAFIAAEFWLLRPVDGGLVCGGVPIIGATIGYRHDDSGLDADGNLRAACVHDARAEVIRGALFAIPLGLAGGGLLSAGLAEDHQRRRRPLTPRSTSAPPPPPPPPGTMTPDGRWRWTGSEWVPGSAPQRWDPHTGRWL